jgi:hypothetical protein
VHGGPDNGADPPSRLWTGKDKRAADPPHCRTPGRRCGTPPDLSTFPQFLPAAGAQARAQQKVRHTLGINRAVASPKRLAVQENHSTGRRGEQSLPAPAGVDGAGMDPSRRVVNVIHRQTKKPTQILFPSFI